MDPGSRHPLRGGWKARGACVVAGALPSLAFPEANLWPLAGIGFVPLLLLVRRAPSRREGGLLAWLGGSAWLLATHHWLIPNVGPFLPLLTLGLGLLWWPWGAAAWSLLSAPVTARRARAAVGLLPAGWVLIELVRSWEYLGGPFGLLGASLSSRAPLLSAAALGGIWAVSYIAMAVNVALVAAVVAVDGRARSTSMALAALLVSLGPIYYVFGSEPRPAGSLRVGLVQPGVIHGADARLAAGERLTRDLIGRGVDLVVWGESSVGFDLDVRPDLRDRLQELAQEIEADLLVNVDALSTARGSIYKSSVLVTAAGVAGRYDKMRLVPFGEQVPLRSLLGWVPAITEAAEVDRSRGESLRLMSSRGVSLGPLVCFESAFADMSRTLARMGAEIIVVQSSTSTFQASWAPEAHASLAAVRAMETGRPVIHSTLTGVTAVFDARARRLEWLSTDHTGARVVQIPLASRATPYTALGDWVVYASAVACAGAAIRARSARRTVTTHEPRRGIAQRTEADEPHIRSADDSRNE